MGGVPGMVTYAFSPNTQERQVNVCDFEASLLNITVTRQPELLIETLCQNKRKTNKSNPDKQQRTRTTITATTL